MPLPPLPSAAVAPLFRPMRLLSLTVLLPPPMIRTPSTVFPEMMFPRNVLLDTADRKTPDPTLASLAVPGRSTPMKLFCTTLPVPELIRRPPPSLPEITLRSA